MRQVPKFFNTAGPINPADHFNVEPLSRINLEEIESLIYQKKYFVLHAPRQTGKTSCMLALRDYLNARGEFIATYITLETGQIYFNKVSEVNNLFLSCVSREMRNMLNSDIAAQLAAEVLASQIEDPITTFLSRLCKTLPRPLILLIDEIDILGNDSLASVLRQIHWGDANRPALFPQSIILCGMRDVFGCSAESLHLYKFSEEQICELYMQHTAATGQEFDEACFPLIWAATEGQPWLVNALGYEVTYNMKENRDRSIRIIPEMILKAQEEIIGKRDTFIMRLNEERFIPIIDAILGDCDSSVETSFNKSDVQFLVDRGFLIWGNPVRISNGLYSKSIPFELIRATESGLLQQSAWYINPDNSINTEKLLLDFQQFFRQNADSWIEKFDYKESGPQLLLQAFLQRVVNGGGYIDREYGLGRGRTDLLITKPLTDGYGGPMQRIVLELKIKRGDLATTIAKGLEQTTGYMNQCGGVINEGHFIVFDRTPDKSWEEKLWHRTEQYAGRTITVWGM